MINYNPPHKLHSEPTPDRFRVFKCFSANENSDEFILVAAETNIEAANMVAPDYSFDEPEEIPSFYSPTKGILGILLFQPQ